MITETEQDPKLDTPLYNTTKFNNISVKALVETH